MTSSAKASALRDVENPDVRALFEATLHLLGLLGTQPVETDLIKEAVSTLAALIGARYGALALLNDEGDLERFVYTGLSDDDAKTVGRLPDGVGLLGLPIAQGCSGQAFPDSMLRAVS